MNVSAREIVKVIIIFLIVFGAVQFSIDSYRVDGTSMEPSFYDNQYLLVDKIRYRFSSPARGDVIIFRNPQAPNDTPLIKRIVGMPGEKVDISEGHITIDGNEMKETPTFPAIPSSYSYSVTVPADQYFVLGDNRSNSLGSHIFGPVPQDNILGRVWIFYWPPSDWGLSPEYSATPEAASTASLGHW